MQRLLILLVLEIVVDADNFLVPDAIKSVKREILQMKPTLVTLGTESYAWDQKPSVWIN